MAAPHEPGSTLAPELELELELEGSVDRAAELLERYDPQTRRWTVAKQGSFWQACALLATHPPRFGVGSPPVVAVVDGAFDTSLPALAEHELVWDNDEQARTTHGTIVALLVLEVVPAARLLLYPASRGGRLDEQRAADAVLDAGRRGASVINLSMARKRPVGDWFDADGFFASLDDTAYGAQFAAVRAFADAPFRQWLTVPPSALGEAAVRSTLGGSQVVAAAGNASGTLASPAVLPHVLSVGFLTEHRSDEGGLETTEVRPPDFAQSAFDDVAVLQPPDVLGSSFATPLVSGLLAGACSPAEFTAFREMVRLGGLASRLWALTRQEGATWVDGRDGEVDALFLRAVRASPHPHHLQPGVVGPCAACAFFALQPFLDFGLFKLNWSDLVGAELLLRTARAFAPASAYAAANLAVVLAVRADAVDRSLPDAPGEIRRLLAEAEQAMSAAVDLRPGHRAYAAELASYRSGLADPRAWSTRPWSPPAAPTTDRSAQ